MAITRKDLPEGIDALRVALLAERARAERVEAELAVAKAKASDDAAVMAHQRLQIEKLTHELYGQRSERTVRLLDQCPASAPMRQKGRVEEGSDCLLGQAGSGCRSPSTCRARGFVEPAPTAC
jgi:hypothetical protein